MNVVWTQPAPLAQKSHPAFSCRDVLQGPDGGLLTGGAAFSALQNELVEHHHLGVPQPLGPLGLPGHFGQYGHIVVALARRDKGTDRQNHDSGNSQQLFGGDADAAAPSVFAFAIFFHYDLTVCVGKISRSFDFYWELWVVASTPFISSCLLHWLLRTQHRKYLLETTTHKVFAGLVRQLGVTALPSAVARQPLGAVTVKRHDLTLWWWTKRKKEEKSLGFKSFVKNWEWAGIVKSSFCRLDVGPRQRNHGNFSIHKV